MGRTSLDIAKRFMKRRKFGEALSILEEGLSTLEESLSIRGKELSADEYSERCKGLFDYYLTAGIACLYLGDTGNAKAYFEKANRISLTNTLLMNAFAVLYLRRGDTIRATQKYIEVQEADPENELAKRGLDFLEKKGTPEEIVRLLDSGEIEKFYPPLGVNPDIIGFSILAGVFGVLLALGILFFSGKHTGSSRNVDWSGYTSVQNYSNIFDDDADTVYELKDSEIKKSWKKIKSFIEEERDNAARVEINRLLNSNASSEVKNQVSEAEKLLEEPDLMNLKDSFTIQQVLEEPVLYSGCFVYWEGRVMNEVVESGLYQFDLIIEDNNNNKMLGIPVKFDFVPLPPVDSRKPIKIFGSINFEGGRVFIRERNYYQSVR
ncbi:MAG: hypothetical protein IJP61_02520 [Treponema sp.]|nr:hypothetical protein [Treponema sp.]